MPVNRVDNQLHGKKFEDVVQKLFGFPNQYIRDLYDVPEGHNDDWDLPVSVKTTCRDRIDLASAPRFFRNQRGLHLVVAHYVNIDGVKVVTTVTTYLLSKATLRKLKGRLPVEQVELFDEGLKMFGRGEHEDARVYAEARKAGLLSFYGEAAIMLNPKIDQQTQRRVQCSIRLADLEPYKICETTTNYKGLKLPYRIQ